MYVVYTCKQYSSESYTYLVGLITNTILLVVTLNINMCTFPIGYNKWKSFKNNLIPSYIDM
jgi:hypothetical protein